MPVIMLNIYIDNSGSMECQDKLEVAKYIARGIKNANFYTLDGAKIEVDSLDSISINNDRKISINTGGINVLLSDGLLEGDKNIFDIALAIGIDADVKFLQTIAQKVYTRNEVVGFLAYLKLRSKSGASTESAEGDSWD